MRKKGMTHCDGQLFVQGAVVRLQCDVMKAFGNGVNVYTPQTFFLVPS